MLITGRLPTTHMLMFLASAAARAAFTNAAARLLHFCMCNSDKIAQIQHIMPTCANLLRPGARACGVGQTFL